jgi:hypothetical protein
MNHKVDMSYMDINELAPYVYNPRDNSGAIESVANSIRTFGFLVPVVVDGNNVLVAGHTRVEAAKTLGLSEVPVIKAEFLTEDQIDAFRIIDNKVSEIARWDFDLLANELGRLKDSGIVFTDFGFAQEEIDCLTDAVADDCLNVDNLVDQEARDRVRRVERRAPATARIVIGEIVFFIPASDYRNWVAGIRDLCDYDELAIAAELKRRLGMRAD